MFSPPLDGLKPLQWGEESDRPWLMMATHATPSLFCSANANRRCSFRCYDGEALHGPTNALEISRRGQQGGSGSAATTRGSISPKTREPKRSQGNALERFSSARPSPSPPLSGCLRILLSTIFLVACLFLYLVPARQQSPPHDGCRKPDVPLSQEGKTAGFGMIFASAALCSVNVCVNGTCYENGGLQICVCDKPYSGPLCNESLSMCTDGCGIRTSTGIDCSSALCSLGTCVDTNTEPYFNCDCGDFFTGTNCETHSNPCTNPAANPCGQGTCTFAPGKGSGTVTCTCSDDYEAALGAGVTTVKWGNSEVIQSPPCTVRKSRGIAKLHVTLSSGELLIWWAIFAAAILMLVWCCYTVFTESCARWSTAFRAARATKRVTG